MTGTLVTEPDLHAERRVVTVLFADLVGYSTLSEGRDPELIQECLNLCFERLSATAAARGGHMDKVVGDEIMILFGAPRAQEDDAGRAVEAALAMQAELDALAPHMEAQLGRRLDLRVGINTGLVVTGAIGPGGYTVTGDAVNVAARLETAARPGDVLVGEATRMLARRQFLWGERQEISVKGRAEMVACFSARSLEATSLRCVTSPSDTPYVGHEAELATIEAAWRAAAAGQLKVVQVVGEAGIGKTRLAAHFLAQVRLPAEQELYTRADTPPRTFGPLLELLSASSRAGSPKVPAGGAELAGGGGGAAPRAMGPDWIVVGLRHLVESLARRGTVALILDDMHRADAATLQVIERLLLRLQGLPVLVALLRQPSGRPLRIHGAVETINLGPLSDDDAGALVAAVAPLTAPERRAAIVERAGGHPLYLELLAATDDPGGEALPASVQAAVLVRVDELDTASAQILREASIFGPSFLEEPLKVIASAEDGLRDTLARLCEAGLLEVTPGQARGYRFRHSLVHQVVYEGMLRRRRTELHARAAEALELARESGADVDPAQVAYHLEAAGDGERAATHYLAAAERADDLRAAASARMYRRAANRLLNLLSLTDLYTTSERPGVLARMGSAGTQLVLALALVVPAFLLFTVQRPASGLITLGLPLSIINFNPSSIVVAISIGGLPLLVAGIAYSHAAAPYLFRRSVSGRAIIATALMGWMMGFSAVLIGFGALVGLLRLGALDHLSSMYVGAATLRLLIGDFRLAVTMFIGTFVVSLVWTAILRAQGRRAARPRRGGIHPRQYAVERRWLALRHTGTLLAAAAALFGAMLVAYQAGIFPHSDVQPTPPATAFVGLLAACVAALTTGGGTALLSDRRLSRDEGRSRAGLFGFEVPLLAAIAFGAVSWYGMRQAVIVAANDVDSPTQLSAYRHATQLFPDLALAQYLLGERYMANRDTRQARASLERAIALDPSFAASYLARGVLRMQTGGSVGARADAETLIALEPRHPAGYLLRAWAESVQHDTVAAERDLAIAQRPAVAGAVGWDVYFVQCLAFHALKQEDRAQAACERVLQTNPRHYISLDTLGLIAFRKGDYASSASYWTRLLAIDDRNAKAWSNLGISYFDLGAYARAEPALQRALAIDPSEGDALAFLAVDELFLGRADQALAAAGRAVAVDAQQRCIRIVVARYSDRHQLVIDDTTALLEAWQNGRICNTPATPALHAYLLSVRGLAYVQSGRWPSGIRDLDQALQLDPTYAAGYDRRGYAYYLLGTPDALAHATADYQRAYDGLTTLDRDAQADLHYHRALLLRAEGSHDLALSEAEAAAKAARIPSVETNIAQLVAALGG